MSKITELAVPPKVGDWVEFTTKKGNVRRGMIAHIAKNPDRPEHYMQITHIEGRRKIVSWPKVSDIDFLQLELPISIQ